MRNYRNNPEAACIVCDKPTRAFNTICNTRDSEHGRKRQQIWRLNNPEIYAELKKRDYLWRRQHTEYQMLERARARAKVKNTECTITIEDIKIPDVCPILKIKLSRNFGKSGGRDNSPSLDRIDSSKGYIPGNIWVISNKANTMKHNATKNELVRFAKWVLENYGEEEA